MHACKQAGVKQKGNLTSDAHLLEVSTTTQPSAMSASIRALRATADHTSRTWRGCVDGACVSPLLCVLPSGLRQPPTTHRTPGVIVESVFMCDPKLCACVPRHNTSHAPGLPHLQLVKAQQRRRVAAPVLPASSRVGAGRPNKAARGGAHNRCVGGGEALARHAPGARLPVGHSGGAQGRV